MAILDGIKARLKQKAQTYLLEYGVKKALGAIVKGAVALAAGAKLAQYGVAVSIDPQAAEKALALLSFGFLEAGRNLIKRKLPGLFGWL